MEPSVALLHRWAVLWLAGGDTTAGEEILASDYAIRIGGHVLDGRAAYMEATLGQLRRFPGLGLTVHELVVTTDRAAVRFTEHGADAEREGRAAAWGGIALFELAGGRLSRCVAEEDYLARRRQLESGICDAIEPPAPAPFSVAPRPPDPDAEAVVRSWLSVGDLSAVSCDDAWLGQPPAALIDDADYELDELFSAGASVAFHARATGTYAGGLDGVSASRGEPAAVELAGLVQVSDGVVHGGHIVRDRLGLRRSLLGRAASD